MSVNYFCSNDSLLYPQHDSISESLLGYFHCFFVSPSSLIFITFNITNVVLLLPLCIFILYHGLQQWRSTSSAATMSHSDSFTYHMVTVELIGVFGGTISCFGIYKDNFKILLASTFLLIFTWCGKVSFHILTCVERYLAVVLPITYMSLRKERGIRIRNISIACVWLLSFAGMGLVFIENLAIVYFFNLLLSLTVISFCSLSVLCVLIHSGPGERVSERERVDQSKLKAFYTIMAILGVLVLRLAWGILWAILYLSGVSSDCVIMVCESWFNLPSSLVVPLLFLHRTGKMACCKNNIQ